MTDEANSGMVGPSSDPTQWVLAVYGSRAVKALRDIDEFAGMAQRLVDRGRHVYDSDEAITLACEAVIHRVGEAVARLPDEFIADFPALRLKGFKGMRNLVAHRYHDIDILWETMTVEIPMLHRQLEEILLRQ